MVLSNFLTLSQISGHVILVILTFLVFVTIQINLSEFNNHCLLFATGNWNTEGLFDVRWPSVAFCKFPIISSWFICILSIYQIYRYSILAYRNQEPSFLGLFIDVLFGVFKTAFSIISAIIITLGFITWCSDITERFPSCDMAAGQNITGKPDGIHTSGFYIEMGIAQFGAWGCFAISVGVAVIALLKIIHNHQIRNIRVSMYNERQHLVNEDGDFLNSTGRSSPPPPNN